MERIENMDLNLAGSKKKYREKKKYSIITLDLFKPTKNSYPEFDYEQICKEYLVCSVESLSIPEGSGGEIR